MEKFVNLLLFFAVLLTASCKKQPLDPCIDGICPCPDTMYFSKIVYVDTFVMMDAEYIFPLDMRTDTFAVYPMDSIKLLENNDGFRACYTGVDIRFLLDDNDSLSFVYRGGRRGYRVQEPIYVPYSLGCDPTNSVIVYETEYDTLYHVIPYAILEIFTGNESYIDTAFYPIEFSTAYEDYYTGHYIDSFNVNGYHSDSIEFNTYLESNYYNIGSTGYYLIDVDPPEDVEPELMHSLFYLYKNN